MKFHLIYDENSGLFLGNQFEEGFCYSSYTAEDASFNRVFKPLKDYMNVKRNCRLMIFENKYAAEYFINSVETKFSVNGFNLRCISVEELEKKEKRERLTK